MSYIGKNPKVDSVKLDGSATVPAGASVEGQVYYNTGTGSISKGLKVYKNSQFVSIDKQLGDADTFHLLKASDLAVSEWSAARNSTSTSFLNQNSVPFETTTASGVAGTFSNSSTGDALLTDESADLVFNYKSSGTSDDAQEYFGIPLSIPKAFRGGNVVLSFVYRTENDGSDATADGQFEVSVLDKSTGNGGQTTSTNSTTDITAGSAITVASKTGLAVGQRIRLEAGSQSAIGSPDATVVESYITSVSSTANEITISKDWDTPHASGAVVVSGWLTDVLSGQLPGADSDTNKQGKRFSLQFKTEDDTSDIVLFFQNKNTSSTDSFELFVDNILLSANKFLQASSQTKTEYYFAKLQDYFWDSTGSSHYYVFNEALVLPKAGTPPLADSQLITIGDRTGPGTIGTVSAIEAKQKCTVTVATEMYADNSGEITIMNQDEEEVLRNHAPNSAAAGYKPVSATVVLEKGDYLFFRNHEIATRWGSLAVTATPQTSPVVLLESQDEIFTDWQSFTPSFSTGGGPPTVHEARWRRVGSDMEVYMGFAVGTTTASNAKFDVPGGYSIDATAFSTTTSNYHPVGNYGVPNQNYSANTYISANVTTPTILYFTYADSAGYNYNTVRDWNHLFSSSEKIECWFKIPIQGWNTNFNPLLSMPLVEIGSDYEDFGRNNFGGYASSYAPYLTGTDQNFDNTGNIISVVNSSTEGIKITALVDCFLNCNMRMQFSTANSGHAGWVKNNAIESITSVDKDKFISPQGYIGSTIAQSGGITLPVINYPLKAGDYVRFLTDGDTFNTADANQRVLINAVRDRGNTNMAHIIKPAVAVLSEQVAGGSTASNAGGTSGTGFNQRRINTAHGETWFVSGAFDGIGGTNVNWTLEPGTYEFDMSSPAYSTDYTSQRLYDVTNSVEVPGSCSNTLYLPSGASDYVTSKFTHTITSSTEFKIETYVTTGRSTDGLGVYNGNTANNAVFSQIKIRKLK